jgi:hypothetical protein
MDINPTQIPNKFTLNTTYEHQTKPNNVPKYFNYKGHKFKISDFIYVKGILDNIYYYPTSIESFKDFSDFLTRQFPSIVRDIRFLRYSGCKMTHMAMSKLYEYLIPTREIDFNLSPYLTYSEWLYNKEDLSGLLSAIENTNDKKKNYFNLYKNIIDCILPISDDRFFKYLSLDNSKVSNVLYERLKNLFVQLCSYNITFLNTERDNTTYFMLSSFPVEFQGPSKHKQGFVSYTDLSSDNLKYKITDKLNLTPSNTSIFIDKNALLTDIKVMPQTSIILKDNYQDNLIIYSTEKADQIKNDILCHDINIDMSLTVDIGLNE